MLIDSDNGVFYYCCCCRCWGVGIVGVAVFLVCGLIAAVVDVIVDDGVAAAVVVSELAEL